MEALIEWLLSTQLSNFVLTYRWAWPIAETVHFVGLVLLFGSIATFDFRVLGVGMGIAPRAVHRLVPFGVLGFCLSALTGFAFISGTPDQYFYNWAFYGKVTFLVVMGLNAIYFYSCIYAEIKTLGPYDSASRLAKVSACVSLVAMVAIMCCGRMLTFFRPPGPF